MRERDERYMFEINRLEGERDYWRNSYTTVIQERDKAITLLRSVRSQLVAAPELNMANYSEDDVSALNDAVNAVCCELDASGLGLSEGGSIP